mmetsp:Transcript_5767/g.17697  ORF Transcript_5767/g.17697 Transcript_5767/m.17697 type:complete len:211 (-) Transcript_5767:97-729(-)
MVGGPPPTAPVRCWTIMPTRCGAMRLQRWGARTHWRRRSQFSLRPRHARRPRRRRGTCRSGPPGSMRSSPPRRCRVSSRSCEHLEAVAARSGAGSRFPPRRRRARRPRPRSPTWRGRRKAAPQLRAPARSALSSRSAGPPTPPHRAGLVAPGCHRRAGTAAAARGGDRDRGSSPPPCATERRPLPPPSAPQTASPPPPPPRSPVSPSPPT